MSTIFISHNSADRAWAERIREWLAGEGHDSVYLAFHPEDGTGVGVEWQKDLYRKIRACRVMVVLWSQASRASDWCFAEISQARALGRDVFPLKVGEVDDHPLLFGLQFIDLTADVEEGYERLREGLRRVGVDDSFKWDRSRPPYPGFLAFDRADAAVYFGRGPEIRKSLNLLNQVRMQERSRLVLVLGASGSGKSSLVRAGIYPRLGRDPEDWLLLEPFRPRAEPIKELAGVLADALPSRGEARSWRDIEAALTGASDPGQALVGMLEDLLRGSAHREATVVLFIDQLEELLGHPENHPARSFLSMLRKALLVEESPLLVLGTMRSDSLPTFQQDASLVEVEFESVSLSPLGPGRLRQIIEGPAQVADVELEDGLVEELLDDTRSGESLPLLAFTLRELYEKYADDRLLELDEYEDLGRLKGAVRKAAERAAEGLDEDELTHLRHAFLRLVRISDEGQYLRRTTLLSELPERARTTVEKFVDRRLLIAREAAGGTSVEVAHEALFRSWDRLRDWLDLDREALLVHHRVEASAALWQRENRASEYLWRGARLERAIAFARAGGWVWAQEATDELELTREFLEESVAAEEKSQREEVEQRRRLDEARRQKVRNRNWLLGVAAVAMVVLAVFLGLLLDQRSELSDTLSLNYWQRARGVAESDPLLTAQLLAQALVSAQDEEIVHSLHVSYGSTLRYLSLEEILEAEGAIDGARFSDDGASILTWGDDGVVHLWQRVEAPADLADPRWTLAQSVPRMLVDGNVDRVLGASFLPGAGHVLVWTKSGSSRLWDVDPGRIAVLDFGLPEARHAVKDLVWRPGVNQGYVVRMPNERLEPIDYSSTEGVGPGPSLPVIEHPVDLRGREGEPERESERRPNIYGARFDRSGARLLSWGADGAARLWDVASGAETACFQHGVEPRSWALGARFDGAERRVVTWGNDGFVRVWEIAGAAGCGDSEASQSMRHSGPVTDVVFADAGETAMLSWSADATGWLWRPDSGELLGTARGTATPRARLGPGARVLVWGEGPSARIWKLEFSSEMQRSMAHEGAVAGALFGPKEESLLTFDWCGQLKRWDDEGGESVVRQYEAVDDLPPRKTLCRSLERPDAVRGAAYDPAGSRILAWNRSGAIHLLDADLGEIRDFAGGHEGPALGADFLPDGRRVLTWSRDGTARLWDASSGEEAAAHPLRPAEGQWIDGAVWSEAQQGVWTWTDKGLLTFWDENGNPAEKSRSVEGALADAEATRLFVWDAVGKGELIDLATGASVELAAPIDQGQTIEGAAFGRESLLTWTRNGPVNLWHLDTGRQIGLSHPGVTGATFSRDGDLVLTWSEKAANLWDRHGSLARSIRQEGLEGARITPDKRMLLTWGDRAPLVLWGIRTGNIVARSRPVACVSRTTFDREGRRILFWCDREPVAGIWEIPGDPDFPVELLDLELQVRTGRKFNPKTLEEEPLDRQIWVEAKRRYAEAAERHLAGCQYRNNNVYSRFYEATGEG